MSGSRAATNLPLRGASAWTRLAAVLLLLIMPTTYHGGAEVAHAHAVFQFWLPGSAEAADHHGHTHDHELPPGAAVGPEGADAPFATTKAPPDTPVLSEMTFTAEGASHGALALAAFGLWSFPIDSLIISIATSLSAITRTPDLPPPR